VRKSGVNPDRNFFGLSESTAKKPIVVVGIPWDVTSSYTRGAAAAPDAIRKATDARLYNHYTEQGVDLTAQIKVCDHGNVKKAWNAKDLKKNIASAIRMHHHENAVLLFLGGDHFVTFPAFESVAELHGQPLSLLYFDAHPDLYETYEGNLNSHATVVSRILDNRHASNGKVCYVGLRASTREQESRIVKLGLTKHTSNDVFAKGSQEICDSLKSMMKNTPVYLSIDLDCLDPAYAPGVGNPQPAGLSSRQLFNIIQNLDDLEIVAADIVEYSPRCDTNARTTAFTSAVLIKEVMWAMTKRPRR
jgi:agmatinase